ncbi:DUF4811 domain-containing protein [Limosilactobacillus oris]|uniref:DUF4811 domain-containing protein n=1 Tax=Limosilactobacillus oris TaxID=1632 RepID=UPI0024B35FC3|nr:DUF4811 domain-containing protein [Limosilactobacillus oris]WHO85368.1 DUF4811 domain-containing protein [Limosilactobacillus oris]
MIIIIMFGAAIAMFASIMFIERRVPQLILATLCGLLFVCSTLVMTLNYSHHFGMHQVTTTTRKPIYSASNSTMPLALYQPVGTSGQDNVYIYNVKPRQKTTNHTQADEYTTSKIKWTNEITPKLVTTETRWRYNNNFFAALYMWSGMDGTLVKRTNTLEYPRTYVKITVKQANRLKKLAQSPVVKQAQARAQQQGKTAVASTVQAALAKNPHMTAQQIQQVSQQAEQQLQGQMVKEMLKSAK